MKENLNLGLFLPILHHYIVNRILMLNFSFTSKIILSVDLNYVKVNILSLELE